jgi:hypothetical protein
METLLPLEEPVVLAFLLGLFTAGLMLAAWYGVPALWWWWNDRHPFVDVDELLADEDVETCDLCQVVLTDDVRAITCDAHRYCGDCDDASNRCTACAEVRWSVLMEEIA